MTYPNDQICYLCRVPKWSGTSVKADDDVTYFICFVCERTHEGRDFLAKINRERFDAELEELRQNHECRFVDAYGRYCRKGGWPLCHLHQNVKCAKCGAKATHAASIWSTRVGTKPQFRCDLHGITPQGDYSQGGYTRAGIY